MPERSDANATALDCIQRSARDGWDQATGSGCLHETAYYCIRVADKLPASPQQTVKELILEKSRGNPFFVEEVVRSLIASGMVYQTEEVWRAREGIESVTVRGAALAGAGS